MAKKKKYVKRRKVGAFSPSGNVMKLATVAAGYLLANKINPIIDKAVPDSISGEIVLGVQVLGGGYLLMSKGGSRTVKLVKTAVGGVVAGAGIKRALQAFGVIKVSGYQSVPVIGNYGKVPVISGYTPSGTLAGYKVPKPIHDTVMGSSGSGYMP